MNKDIVKFAAALAALFVLSGCASTNTADTYAPKSMISAAEFDAMIEVEIRELEPLPVEAAVVAMH